MRLSKVFVLVVFDNSTHLNMEGSSKKYLGIDIYYFLVLTF